MSKVIVSEGKPNLSKVTVETVDGDTREFHVAGDIDWNRFPKVLERSMSRKYTKKETTRTYRRHTTKELAAAN